MFIVLCSFFVEQGQDGSFGLLFCCDHRDPVTPKSDHSMREAALAEGLLGELRAWRSHVVSTRPNSFVFPSERGTALSKDNVWRRNMLPKLTAIGLGWANFQVMRRTHATLMRETKADPHQVAAQLGYAVDVNLNIYAQFPVEVRLPLVNQLENLVVQ